jgi:hypothetical protein
VQNAADLVSFRALFPHMKIRLERLNRDEAVVVRERGAFGLIGRKALCRDRYPARSRRQACA